VPLLSTLVLLRVAWSAWRLRRLDAQAPSLWLSVLDVTPAGLRLAAGGGGGSAPGDPHTGYDGSGGSPGGDGDGSSGWRRE
jgi:hypothetical protein